MRRPTRVRLFYLLDSKTHRSSRSLPIEQLKARVTSLTSQVCLPNDFAANEFSRFTLCAGYEHSLENDFVSPFTETLVNSCFFLVLQRSWT